MSAHEANWMLRKKPSGTFLIRFSKSQAGCFAVTFVDSKGQVKHSLLYSLTDQWGLTLKNPPKGKNFTTFIFRIRDLFAFYLLSIKGLLRRAIHAHILTISGNSNFRYTSGNNQFRVS
jgi:hypothetical protein